MTSTKRVRGGVIGKRGYRLLLSVSAVAWFVAAASSSGQDGWLVLLDHVLFTVTGLTLLFVAWRPGTRGPMRWTAYLVGITGLIKAADFVWIALQHGTRYGIVSTIGTATQWVALTVYTLAMVVFGWTVTEDEVGD